MNGWGEKDDPGRRKRCHKGEFWELKISVAWGKMRQSDKEPGTNSRRACLRCSPRWYAAGVVQYTQGRKGVKEA